MYCSALQRHVLWLCLFNLVVVCGTACGGRSLGRPGDDAQVPPPDVYWAGCQPPSDQVAISTPGEPCFVYSLDRTNSGQYVLASSQGWNEQSAALRMLDGDSLVQLGSIGVDAQSVHARFDQWSGGVLTLAETDNEVWFQHYQIAAGRNLNLGAELLLCDNCVAAWGGPDTVEAFKGAAVRDLTDDRLRVYVMPEDEPGEIYTSQAIEGSSPQLAASGEELMLLYLHNQRLWTVQIDRHGALTPPNQRSNSPIQSLLGADSYSDGIVVAAVLTADSNNPQLELIKMMGNSDVSRFNVPAPATHAEVGAVSFSPHTVGVAWGQGSGDVGAHFLGALTQSFDPIFGPSRVSELVNQTTSSYTIWASTAYHPTGHAVIWGGWHEERGYGIYGKIIPCTNGF